VLNLQWLPSYPSAGFQSTMEMRTVSADGTPSRGLDFPNAYYEVVYRVPQNTPENTPSFQPYQAFWVYFRGPAAVEYDFVENYGTLESAAWHDWSRSGAGNSIWNESNLPGFDSTQYHTYAGRITSDGNTATAFCGYVDNVLRGTCQDPGTSVHNSRRFLIINNGPYSNSIPAAMNLYVKTIRVWSCASWQTTMCNGTVLTTAP
jgi:hypothetical protein